MVVVEGRLARKRHGKLAVRESTTFPSSSQIEPSLMFFAFLHSKSGYMSSTHVGAFAQRVSRMILQREVAVALTCARGSRFSEYQKEVALRRLYTTIKFCFPF
jgi:hypothetical protein